MRRSCGKGGKGGGKWGGKGGVRGGVRGVSSGWALKVDSDDGVD